MSEFLIMFLLIVCILGYILVHQFMGMQLIKICVKGFTTVTYIHVGDILAENQKGK